MFGKIKRLCERGQNIDGVKLLQNILKDEVLQAQIIDLNQSQMYDKGIQSDGASMGEYAPVTINYWKPLLAANGRGILPGRALITSHITGYDTGETYRSMEVIVGDEGFKIHADDRNDFFEREPKGLGLTSESLLQIRPEIKSRLIEGIKAEVFKR